MVSLRVALPFATATFASGLDLSVNVESTLTFDVAGAKNRPVAKVITVLKDMLEQLEKESKEDEDIYESVTCWCETNDKEKTKAIGDAEAKIEDLGVKIEEYTARSGKLGTEIKKLEKEVAKNQGALDKATEIREKELSEFNGEEKDLLESVSALKSAVTVLSKHQGSFVQMPKAHLSSIAKTLNVCVQKHQSLLQGVFTRKEKRAITAFVDNAQAPVTDGSYAPASGQIFGILNQMKETFEQNLSDGQKTEMNNQASYDGVKKTKGAEIQAGQNQIDKKTDQLAVTDEKNAQAKQDIKDTKATLSADEQFLMMLKDLCGKVDAEYEARTKERQAEMGACSKALAILSSDDAHDMFTKSFNFMQVRSKISSGRRARAADILKHAATKSHSRTLASLATQVKSDAFERVKKAINDMVAALTKEKSDEIKHKDFCVEEFNTNQMETEKKTRVKMETLAKIEDTDMSIKDLSETVGNLKAQITEMSVQMKRASEDREKENKEFQSTVADQRATQKLLQAALNILKSFYDKKNTTFDKVALVQHKQPAPPAGFKDYSKNKQAGGVQGMIKQIIDDAKAMENDAIRGEEDAQKSYEEFIKDSNTCSMAMEKEIVEKTEENARAKEVLVELKVSRDYTLDELQGLSSSDAELHASCDFVMKNFELRQSSRDEEIEALKQAMAILSGAKLSES